MPVFETYASRAAAAAKAGAPDVYIYNELPPLLRKQVSQIFRECIGPGSPRWTEVAYIMDREVVSFSIENPNSYANCEVYLKTSEDVNGVLSLIQICAEIMAGSIINDNA